jgi:hypothetical protein
MVQAADDVRPLYTTIRLLGLVGVLILVAGLADVLAFAPPGQHTGTQARIVGVYVYGPTTGRTTGDPRRIFGRDQAFAAEVDWGSLPPDMVVGARWYNSLDQAVGGVGPARAGTLAADHAVVVERGSSDSRHNLPGHYRLVVLRYSQGQPVEVLARQTVLVDTGA